MTPLGKRDLLITPTSPAAPLGFHEPLEQDFSGMNWPHAVLDPDIHHDERLHSLSIATR